MKRWVLPLGIIAAAVIISIIVYGRMPEQVAIHWDIQGNADRYASKPLALFMLPVVMLAVLILNKLAPIIDPRKANLKKNRGDIDTINFFLMLVLLAVHVLTIVYSLGYEFDMSIIAPLLAGAIFVVVGNYMPRFKHNYSFGLKTAWTLASENVWRKANAISGRFFFVGGLIMILSLFLPRIWMLVVFFATLIICAVVPVLVSFLLYKKEQVQS